MVAAAMTDRALILIGFAALAVAGVVAQFIARRHPDRLATLGETIHLLQRSRLLRGLTVCAWAWLGWHFLAR
jgi:hypothetical protein